MFDFHCVPRRAKFCFRNSRRYQAVAALFLISLAACTPSLAQFEPKIAEASRDAELALNGFVIPKGMSGSLLAAEPMLANPVAFHVTNDGRIFVCETFRQEEGVEDNRSHMDWLHNDLRLESVEERLAMFRKYLGHDVETYGRQHDRIRLLQDTDGDGLPDKDTVFADGFNGILDGTGAGVIELNDQVYYTCIPRLWSLADTNDDGVADERNALHHGYGVRVAFRGHDMHGLVVGPDGRLYFSIGDRGYNVITKEGTRLKRVDTGAVFRCDADGSNLELFAYGLRNPQELAFDDNGNLFTGDNNSDSGDKARWVYVVQDGDTGWRMYFQYLDDRGPWNRERMWYPWRSDEETTVVQPAYIVPPVANLGDGPSGLTYYPGLGLSDRYRNHFFMADFRGGAANSGIRSFSVEPQGATFNLTDSHEFIWSILGTDVDFAPDGSLYVSDWVNGWVGEGRGRIYRFADDENISAVSGANVPELLAGGIESRSSEELVELLSHADRRVRQAAQFKLVDRNDIELLAICTQPETVSLTARHAIWAHWQLGLQSKDNVGLVASRMQGVLELDQANQTEHAVKVIGDIVRRYGVDVLKKSQRVQFIKQLSALTTGEDIRLAGFAATTLGLLGRERDASTLMTMLDRNANEDPVARHQAVMGLTHLATRNPGLLADLQGHPGEAGRLGVALAMRRLHDPLIADFLTDASDQVATCAARAINDEPIESALPALADIAGTPGLNEPFLRRVMSACYQLGEARYAEQVAAIAADPARKATIRLQATQMLRSWNSPQQTDTVNGRWSEIPNREVDGLAGVVNAYLPAMLAGDDDQRSTAIEVAAILGIRDIVPTLQQMYRRPGNADSIRVASFLALADLAERDELSSLIEAGREDQSEAIRLAALQLLVDFDRASAVRVIAEIVQSGTVAARQKALSLLRSIRSSSTNSQEINTTRSILNKALTKLNDNQLPGAVALDVLMAAEASPDEELASQIRKFREGQQMAGTKTAVWSECLEGGNAARGEAIFFGRSDASCRRCHKVNGSGGEVGPDLSEISKKNERIYLLEALVDPNAKIAKGFETVVVVTIEGRVHSGILKQETNDVLRLMSPQGAIITIAKEDIEERAKGQSGMPVDITKNLSRSDVRDLVEYLSTLKVAKESAHGNEE